MIEHREVRDATDLRNVFTASSIHLVELPAFEEDFTRLRAWVFAITPPSNRLLMASAARGDLSWEVANRLISAEPTLMGADMAEVVGESARISKGDFAVLVSPGLLEHGQRVADVRAYADNVVILARKDVTLIADVEALAQHLRVSGFTIQGVVIVGCEQRRWRKWRRFARDYGVWSDPERPWPVIDVLDEEKQRTSRPGEGGRQGQPFRG